VLIPLHKKGLARICSNYRTNALIPHACKVLLEIINTRLTAFLDRQIPPEAGFVPGRGTREQKLNVRQMVEKAREFNMPLIMCFIHYSKAFDCFKWQSLFEILVEMGVPNHLAELVRSLYESNEIFVRLNGIDSESFKAQKGVRQGCTGSP
jgi:hypothetical protein